MNSSESFIQDYLVISFDLFMYAKITQCKIGSFRNFSKAAHFQVKIFSKILNAGKFHLGFIGYVLIVR